MNEDTLQEVLKKNKERYTERLKQQRERIKKEQREEKIIIACASILILLLLFKVMSNMNKDSINSCVNQGYLQEFCEYILN